MADKRVFGDFEELKFNIITKLYQAKQAKSSPPFCLKIPAVTLNSLTAFEIIFLNRKGYHSPTGGSTTSLS